MSAKVGCFGLAGRKDVIPPLLIMLLGPPSFLAPGMSSLLLLFINFADDDPECEDADEGVLIALPPLADTLFATLPPLANTLRIGRTTLPAGALDVLCEGAAELGLFLIVGPRRGGEAITTSCSETSLATVTPLAVLTLFKRSPKLDLLSSAGFVGGVTCPAGRGGSVEGDSSSCATLSS